MTHSPDASTRGAARRLPASALARRWHFALDRLGTVGAHHGVWALGIQLTLGMKMRVVALCAGVPIDPSSRQPAFAAASPAEQPA